MAVYTTRSNTAEVRQVTPENISAIGEWVGADSWSLEPTAGIVLTNWAGDSVGPQTLTYRNRWGLHLEVGIGWYIVKALGKILAYHPDGFEAYFVQPGEH